jgi:hypothetical protein
LTGTYDFGLSHFSANFGFSKKNKIESLPVFFSFFGKFSQFGNQKKRVGESNKGNFEILKEKFAIS